MSASTEGKRDAARLSARFRGMLLGTAVGDAVGLPAEGLSKQRIQRLMPGPWRHRFCCGSGMISDDTEHALFVVQSLLRHPDAPDRFARRMAWCLRGWFAALPAGVGLATAKACIKLWLGFGHSTSGVRSAGNGAAMRAAPVGAYFHSDDVARASFLERSTRLTHTDERALVGANAIGAVAAWIVRDEVTCRPSVDDFTEVLRGVAPSDTDWGALVRTLDASLRQDASVADFARALGLQDRVSGYVYHTVPVVLFAWHRHAGDFAATLTAVWECGGDTDTTGAIAGALAGLTVGEQGIPREWLDGIREWPRSTRVLRRAADRLAACRVDGRAAGPVRYCWPGIPLRNTLFLAIVLAHGFWRLLWLRGVATEKGKVGCR